MIHKLIEYFSAIRALSKEEIDAIIEDADVRTVKKGTLLLREGQFAQLNYFILDGLVRQYSIENGEENTSNFYSEKQWIFSFMSINEGEPSKHYLECMEDCTLVIGDENRGSTLMQRFPKFQELAMAILEKEIKSQQEGFMKFVKSTPEQRYTDMLTQRPGLPNRIPQYLLASYLGVKPESLSRIRKRIAKNAE